LRLPAIGANSVLVKKLPGMLVRHTSVALSVEADVFSHLA
jgi:hypothetical protein